MNTQTQTRPTNRLGAGPIKGRGTGTSDSIPAQLPVKSFVIPAAVVKRYGNKFFDQLEASVEKESPAENKAEGGKEEGYCKGGKVRMAQGGVVPAAYRGDYDAANQQFLKNGPLTNWHPVDDLQHQGDKAFRALGINAKARADAVSQGLQKPNPTLAAIGNVAGSPGKAVQTAAQNSSMPNIISSAYAGKMPGYAKGGKVLGAVRKPKPGFALGGAVDPLLQGRIDEENKRKYISGMMGNDGPDVSSLNSAQMMDVFRGDNGSNTPNAPGYQNYNPDPNSGLLEQNKNQFSKGGVVPAKVSNGERLISPEAVAKYGPAFFNKLIKTATGSEPPKLGAKATVKKGVNALVLGGQPQYDNNGRLIKDVVEPIVQPKPVINPGYNKFQPQSYRGNPPNVDPNALKNINQTTGVTGGNQGSAPLSAEQAAKQTAASTSGIQQDMALRERMNANKANYVPTTAQPPVVEPPATLGSKLAGGFNNVLKNSVGQGAIATQAADQVLNAPDVARGRNEAIMGLKAKAGLGGTQSLGSAYNGATAAPQQQFTPGVKLPRELRIQQQVESMTPEQQAGYQQSLAATRLGMQRQNSGQAPAPLNYTDAQGQQMTRRYAKPSTPEEIAANTKIQNDFYAKNAQEIANYDKGLGAGKPTGKPAEEPTIWNNWGKGTAQEITNPNAPQVLYWGEAKPTGTGEPGVDSGIAYRQGLQAQNQQNLGLVRAGLPYQALVNENPAATLGINAQRANEEGRHNKATEAYDTGKLAEEQRQFNLGGGKAEKPVMTEAELNDAVLPDTTVNEFNRFKEMTTNTRSKAYQVYQQMLADIDAEPEKEAMILDKFAKDTGIRRENLDSVAKRWKNNVGNY